jgi:hypothetical protein
MIVQPIKMKKLIFTIARSALITVAFLAGCDDPVRKVENAQKSVTGATRDLYNVNYEYPAETENCKKQTTSEIGRKEQSTVNFNARIKNDLTQETKMRKKDTKAHYKKKVAEPELLHTTP